jgi:hypothetical protein
MKLKVEKKSLKQRACSLNKINKTVKLLARLIGVGGWGETKVSNYQH